MTPLVVVRSLSLLVLLCFSLKITNAANIGLEGHSDDGSMVPEDCLQVITHSELTGGVPKLVDDIIASVFEACVAEGSNGKYGDFKFKKFEANGGRRELLLSEAADEEHRELRDDCPQGCQGLISCPQAMNCCVSSGCNYCNGMVATMYCRRRLGSPAEEAFHEEMRRLADTENEQSVSSHCRNELRKVSRELNAMDNYCFGNYDQVTVWAFIN